MPAGDLPRSGYDPELLALLTVDVDTGPLDRGLDEARRRTGVALNDMGQRTQTFSRAGRFAFQNVAFQVQDFAVQVAGGQGAVRALAQNLPQLLGGFGLYGAAAGAAVAITGGLIQAWIESGGTAEDLGEQIDDLGDRLEDLSDRYQAAAGVARDFAAAQLEAAAQGGLREMLEQQQAALEDYRRALEALRQIATPGTIGAIAVPIDEEAQGALRQLVEAFESGSMTALEFRRELEVIAQTTSAQAATELRELGEAAIAAGSGVQQLRDATTELNSGLRLGALEGLRQKVVELRNDLSAAGVSEGLEAMAEAASKAGIDLSRGLENLPQEVREALEEIRRLAQQIDDANEAYKKGERETKRYADALKDLRFETAALREQTEATERGGLFGGKEASQQVKDLAAAAERFGYTIDTLKDAPPAIREAVQAFVEEKAALRDIEEAHENIQKALIRSNRELGKSLERQRKAQEDALRDRQRERSGEIERRENRIKAGGDLPDEIDAANIAAQELSTTLTDLDNLDFNNLSAGFAAAAQAILAQIAQMIIEALIFKAIMASMGLGGGVPVAGIPGASLGPGFGGATVTPIPTAQHGAIFRRGEMALMTGRVSGAALLEGAGDEAAVPLVRTSTGDLGVAVAGGGGRGGDVYNLHAQRIDPGTVSWLLNQARGQAVPAVVNARARGQMQDRAAF